MLMQYFFNIILFAISASNMLLMHFIYHLRFFCYWVNSKDHFKNDFKKSRTDLGAKLVRDQIKKFPKMQGSKVHLRLIIIIIIKKKTPQYHFYLLVKKKRRRKRQNSSSLALSLSLPLKNKRLHLFFFFFNPPPSLSPSLNLTLLFH